MNTRPAVVAGQFYPGDPDVLSRDLNKMLHDALTPSLDPKALIAPHAGYIYSGPIAATAYNAIKKSAGRITRVVLLGPSHRVAFQGIATPGCDSFQTPLGRIAVDHNAIEALGQMACVRELEEAHAKEHSLEVHLPFLQNILPHFSLVPLVVGNASADEVAGVLELLWGGPETLIVISSDLSHFHSYAEARELDRDTTRAIETFHTDLQGDQACGCRPINGLLVAASRRGLTLSTLDVRNSGDTAGGRGEVVGYGAYALH